MAGGETRQLEDSLQHLLQKCNYIGRGIGNLDSTLQEVKTLTGGFVAQSDEIAETVERVRRLAAERGRAGEVRDERDTPCIYNYLDIATIAKDLPFVEMCLGSYEPKMQEKAFAPLECMRLRLEEELKSALQTGAQEQMAAVFRALENITSACGLINAQSWEKRDIGTLYIKNAYAAVENLSGNSE